MQVHNRLEKILISKQSDIAHSYANASPDLLAMVRDGVNLAAKQRNDFTLALKSDMNMPIKIIAEIKRRSPSKGDLANIADPCQLADCYVEGGADAISILTDKTFFAGDIADLQQVATHLQHSTVPILRKDFILDPIQIAEAALACADAVLLIAKILTAQKLQQLLEFAKLIKMQTIVEVHTQDDIAMLSQMAVDMIAINNRNLNDFSVHPTHGLALIDSLPNNAIKIAASGFVDVALVKQYKQAGFDALLIGEALVRHTHPQQLIQAMKNEMIPSYRDLTAASNDPYQRCTRPEKDA